MAKKVGAATDAATAWLKIGQAQASSFLAGASAALSYITGESMVRAIEADHKDLRKLISILRDPNTPTRRLVSTYLKFSELLRSHSEAEEKVVYKSGLEISALKEEAMKGFIEHGIAKDLMRKMDRIKDHDQWRAHVKVLAELVEHHLQEEEMQLLPKLRVHFDMEARDEMLEKFTRLREKSQSAPAEENAGILALH